MRLNTENSAPAITQTAASAEVAGDRIFTRDFLITGGAAFGFFIMTFMYFPTLPLYIQARGGSHVDISLVVGMGGLMSLLSRPFAGWLVDGFGRRYMLITGTLLAALSSLTYSFAVTLPLIVISRLLGGAALATVTTAATTLINDAVPAHHRGAANSYFGMAVNLATGLGPPFGAFIIGTALLQPAELLLGGTFPSVGEQGNFSVMFMAGVLMAGLAFVMAVLVSDRYRPTGIRRLPGLRSMFRAEAAVPASLNFAMTVPFAAVVSLVPIYARDHGLENPGLFFTAYSGMVLVTRLVAGRLSDAHGRATVFLPGLALVGASMITLAVASSPPMLLLAAMFYGLGIGLAQPSLTAYTADLAPAQARGAAISTFSLGFDLALSFGSWGLGFVVGQAGITGAFWTAAALPFVGIGVYFLYGRHAPPIRAHFQP